MPLVPAFAVVAASLLLNLIVLTGHPTPVRLGERSAAAFLAFDILQLAALLFLTGGLENPFSFPAAGTGRCVRNHSDRT